MGSASTSFISDPTFAKLGSMVLHFDMGDAMTLPAAWQRQRENILIAPISLRRGKVNLAKIFLQKLQRLGEGRGSSVLDAVAPRAYGHKLADKFFLEL